jgi:hypothetical protein
MLDSELYFHRYVEYLYSYALKLPGPVRFITYNFYSMDNLKVLYIAFIGQRLSTHLLQGKTLL